MKQRLKAGGLVLTAILLVVGMTAGPALAASTLNHADGDAPNPQFTVDTLTVDEWNNSDFDNALQYYDDAGDMATLNAEVNTSTDVDDLGNGNVNPYSLTATDIDIAEFGEYPRKGDESGDNSASALDASEWTTTGASVSDVTTAPGVTAVEYDGTASGDYATYSNQSITSDAEKRHVQIAADIASASGTPTLKVEDSDGDYVAVQLYNSSAKDTDDSVLTNSTGEGMVSQVQIGSLTVQGNGDGTMGEIQSLNVTGDVDADFSLINVERTSTYKFGEKYVDTDSDDDDLETETIREPHGEYSINAMDSLGGTFDDAAIMGLSYPAHVSAEFVASDDMSAEFMSDNSFPQWDVLGDIYYRLTLPDAYDLSYSGVTLEQTTNWPGDRYVSVELKEDTGDTAFEDIDNWTELTGSYDAQDKDVTLDSTISTGTNYVVHFELKLTGDEADAMQAASGGAGVMGDSGGGGIVGVLMSPFTWLIGALAALGGRAAGVF
jgi:hypothetical protein